MTIRFLNRVTTLLFNRSRAGMSRVIFVELQCTTMFFAHENQYQNRQEECLFLQVRCNAVFFQAFRCFCPSIVQFTFQTPSLHSEPNSFPFRSGRPLPVFILSIFVRPIFSLSLYKSIQTLSLPRSTLRLVYIVDTAIPPQTRSYSTVHAIRPLQLSLSQSFPISISMLLKFSSGTSFESSPKSRLDCFAPRRNSLVF
jgi:hypothetical protein